MPGPLNFDAFLGWVNVTDPNNIPPDARTLSASDLLRYEKLGLDAAAALTEHSTALAAKLDKDEADTLYATEVSVNSQLAGRIQPAVAEAIAADNTVALAAEAAVEGAIVDLDVLEGGVILEDDLIFAVVDEDGRRTDLEIGNDGHFTQRVVDYLKTKFGKETELQNMEVTGLLFAIVDEDGRRTDIELGPDGHFTQRVVDHIASRIVIPTPPDPTAIHLPSSIPMVVGETYKLYYRDFISALDANHSVYATGVTGGGNYGPYWQFTPTTAGNFTLTVTVLDRLGVTVKTKAVPITVYAAPSGVGRRHLAIGDSITRAGNYSQLAMNNFVGGSTVGSRTYTGALAVEGRGGWSLATYFTQIASNTAGDSPFLFPANVAGAKYWGNTEFWRKVCYVPMNQLPDNGYHFDGFQWMARGYKPAGNPFLYDANGYPVTPAVGDVVVDPTKAAGAQFLEYDGASWIVMTPQPLIEFSFPKYMERYAAAYSAGAPTSISIMLETNDFFSSPVANLWDAWKTRMDAFIASVRQYSTELPIIIMLATVGGTAEKWSAQTVQKVQFDQRMRDAADKIITTYDTTAHKNNKVYVGTFLGTVAPENVSDWVHPAITAGHEDMSGYLAGWIAKLITEGA